jgi:hypothetical protein
LKTGHALIGSYLRRIGTRDFLECRACGALEEMASHILFECRRRSKPRKVFYRELINTGVPLPAAAEDALEARLFSEPRATPALLHFLGGVDLFRDTAHTAKEAELGDQWGWEALREWEDEGVG